MGNDGNKRLIGALNRLLAKKHASALRSATYAALVCGPHADALSKRFQEIASDEIVHADLLRKRICGIGGTPTMEVDGGRSRADGRLAEMIQTSVLEGREAIKDVAAILENIPRLNVLLYRTLEGILKDEQQHLEQLLRLAPGDEEIVSKGQPDDPLEARGDRDSHRSAQKAPLEFWD